MRPLPALLLCVFLFVFVPGTHAAEDDLPEIRITASTDDVIEVFKEAGYWGSVNPEEILSVPPLLSVATSPVWKDEAAALPVAVKKEIFYRSMLPLVLYVNKFIAADRDRLKGWIEDGLSSQEEAALLARMTRHYRLAKEDGQLPPTGPERDALLQELWVRVDIIPAALALGQGAYESGYGTSRFALEGNAYFGQWTYGGKGMAPKEKRASKGNYGVAAYDWPLDSVVSYIQNLNTHRAYAALRARRAEMRAAGQAPTGYELAGQLDSYSERGQEYVDTLRGIMRVNKLAPADTAHLQDVRPILIVDALGAYDAEVLAEEIEALRESGELADIITEMGVHPDDR